MEQAFLVAQNILACACDDNGVVADQILCYCVTVFDFVILVDGVV